MRFLQDDLRVVDNGKASLKRHGAACLIGVGAGTGAGVVKMKARGAVHDRVYPGGCGLERLLGSQNVIGLRVVCGFSIAFKSQQCA